MRRVLITGASGFIGTHCLRRLAREDCEIHAVNRSGAGELAAGATWHAADLRDSAQASALIARIRPTRLLHGAWIATPGLYSNSPENVTLAAVHYRARRGVRRAGRRALCRDRQFGQIRSEQPALRRG